MEPPRNKYHTELFRTIPDCNNPNDAPLSNEKIQYSINIVTLEEDAGANNITLDAHNVTVDTYSSDFIIQIEN